MTKQEVLKDIDKLCADIDKCTMAIVNAAKDRDIEALNAANVDASRLLVSANQELSFLRDYIEENVKEE